MYARRGEVQAAQVAENKGIPFTMSTVSVCPIEEVAPAITRPMWFQLYVLKDQSFMQNVLTRAKAAGVTTLVLTVDMPVPGARYRDMHSGMGGPNAAIKRVLQSMVHPQWAFDVGIFGKPHDLGNISTYRGSPTKLEDYIGWLGDNFDPSICWKDLEWIRDFWDGPIVIKGILDVQDAKDAVKGSVKIFVDSGIRSGLDVVRMLALGADCTLLGRSYIYALAAKGQAGVENLLDLYEKEMRVAITLTGAKSIKELTQELLVNTTK